MKKIFTSLISLILVFSMVVSPAMAAYTPQENDEDNLDISTYAYIEDHTFTLGDVDGDNIVNAVDFWMMRATLLGLDNYTNNIDAIDFDADGDFSAKDTYFMRLCLAGCANPTDYENGNQVHSFKIAGNDISEFSIIIEEDCLYSDNEYMAAELFREYIPRATGINIDIQRGVGTKAHGIYIHDVDKNTEFGKELGQEGYKYEVLNGDLHLYGTDRGNMYAAYEIIEDYLGFGFIDNTYVFIYKQRTVELEEGLSKTFVPGFRYRQSKSSFNSNEGHRERASLPRGINGVIGFAFDKANIPASYYGNFVGAPYIDIHSMNAYYQMSTGTMPDESFGTLERRYEEKFATGEFKDETTWQPCATLESEYQLIFDGFLQYLDFVINAKGIPVLYEDGTSAFSFSLCDNMLWCDCRNCRKQATKTSYTDIYLALKNRGAEDIQKYYPGLKLYTLMYDKTCPVEVVPSEHLIIVLGGTSCGNHPLGTEEECQKNGFYKMSNREFEAFVIKMSELCAVNGAELWTWYYPDTFFWWLYDIPNLYTIFYDVKWMYQHGVTGFYYEGNNLCPNYNFEGLKAYMFSQVAFDPEMTLEEYDALIDDYLYKVYGEGWEYIREFLAMYIEAGDMSGYENGGTVPYCWIGGYDRAFDCVSYEYIRDNYEEMRSLLLSAIEAHKGSLSNGGDYREIKLNKLFAVFELLGLGATYADSYLKGDAESRAEYEKRYHWFYDFYLNSGMKYYNDRTGGTDNYPATCNLDTNPFLQFTGGSMRPTITKALQGK